MCFIFILLPVGIADSLLAYMHAQEHTHTHAHTQLNLSSFMPKRRGRPPKNAAALAARQAEHAQAIAQARAAQVRCGLGSCLALEL